LIYCGSNQERLDYGLVEQKKTSNFFPTASYHFL
jgi:hypothetical protein